MAENNFPQVSGMSVVISTFLVFAVNVIVLFIAQMLFPKYIVLGTHALSYGWAIGISMSKLALLTTFVLPFVSRFELSRKRIFSPMEWMTLYLVINVVGLWVITRFSEQFGLGVTSWMVIVPLAIVMDIVQGMVMTAYGSTLQKK